MNHLACAAAQPRFSDNHPAAADFFAEVVDGLALSPKVIAPKFFYDAEGSRLFDAICDVEEYYPTRTETGILSENIDAIADAIGADCCIFEPGSGSSEKIRLLLDAVRPSTYVPMEISKSHLLHAAGRLADDYPWLDVHAVCTDFTNDLSLPEATGHARKVAFFPGSSIGNFEPADATAFLAGLRETVGDDGGLLIGVDLKKDKRTLHAAYNDADGVTAQFNKNLLARINRELGASFDLDRFDHEAFYDEDKGRIEMHLVSAEDHTVTIGDQDFAFLEGETIHTENSYKYTIDEFQDLAAKANFTPAQAWTDGGGLFSVHYLEAT